MGEAYLLVAAHENVHDIAANNREGYAKMESIVMDTLESLGLDEETLMDVQRALAPSENVAYWREEIVANTVPSILSDEATLKEFVQKMAGADAHTRSAFVKLLDTMRDFLRNTFDKLKNELSWQQMQIISENQQTIERIRSAYFEALDGLKGKNEADVDGANSSVRTSKADTQFSEDKYYKTKISNWEELKDGKRVKVGVVQKGSALNQVGFPNTSMYFDVGKIKKALSDHSDHLSSSILKAIPNMLNNPVVITEYGKNTASVFGDLFVDEKPVVVGVIMTKGRDGAVVINKIRTIHARRDIDNLIQADRILYLDPNKKRTHKWFQVCGITNAPLEGTKYGLIRSIAYSEAADNRKVHFSMQDNVEETDKLLAIHNLTGSKLNGVLELGGLPMPSIAVLKATQGHDRYGDVSVVFDKATIDPKASTRKYLFLRSSNPPLHPPALSPAAPP